MFSSKDSKGFRSYLIKRRNVGIRKKHSSLFIRRITDKEKGFPSMTAQLKMEKKEEQNRNGTEGLLETVHFYVQDVSR